MKISRRQTFWLGFSLAIGLGAAFAIVGVGRSGSSRPSIVRTPAHSLVASLAVFQRPRVAADVLPSAAAAEVESDHTQAPRAEVDPGAPLLDQSRLLLSGLGNWGGSLYAVPTASGKVCEQLTGGSGGCLDAQSLAEHGGIGWTLLVRGAVGVDPVKVYGIVPDTVVGVAVVDDKGGRTPARLGENAYFVELPRGDLRPVSLEVRYRNGTTAVIPLPPIGQPPPGP